MYYVTYIVQGFAGQQKAGPYATVQEARRHANDIGGYEGVLGVNVIEMPHEGAASTGAEEEKH